MLLAKVCVCGGVYRPIPFEFLASWKCTPIIANTRSIVVAGENNGHICPPPPP